MTQYRSVLKASPSTGPTILDRLSTQVRGRLEQLARPASYPAGAVLLHEGAATPFVAVVEAGRVALQVRVPERGDRITTVTVEPGELLGWSGVVAPFRATMDAVAMEPTRLLALDAPALRDALAADHELGTEFLPLVLESVSARLTASWTQLLDLFGSREPRPW